jgi:hypothetical protein
MHQQSFTKTTAPIPMTDWFPASGDPAIIGRVVLVKRINVAESKKQRKEVYIEFPAIEHKVAGLSGDISFALIKEEADPDTAEYWIRRFRAAWEAYKGASVTIDGTPLEDWDNIPANMLATLKTNGLTTVEQLAIISDAHCDSLGTGSRKWRTAAQKFVRARATSGFGNARYE